MFDVSSFLNVFPSIMSGFGVTVFLAVLSLCLGCVLAMVIVVFRVKRIPVVSQLARVVISFSRSVPLIVTLYVLYYGLPSLFPALFLTSVSGNFVAVLALGIFAGGYLAETFRSSYEAVPVGQTEAARTVGLNQWQTLYHVVIPQTRSISSRGQPSCTISRFSRSWVRPSRSARRGTGSSKPLRQHGSYIWCLHFLSIMD